MVVAYHANGLLAVPGGLRANVLDDVRFNLDSGVELFFVLSGYLIALPFLRALVSGGELPGIAAYGLRRAARILPAYWLVLTAALAMSTHAPGATPTGLQLVPHVLLLHGLVPGEISRPLPIAWTLSVEMVFYILVPLAALALARRRRHSIRSLAIGALLVWAASAGAAFATAGLAPTASWSLVVLRGAPGVLCQFCPGIIVALAHIAAQRSRQTPRERLGSGAPYVVGGLLLWAASLALSWGGATAAGVVGRNQICGLGFGFVLLGMLALPPRETPLVRLLAPIGTVSYGIYLWHWLAFQTLLATGLKVGLAMPVALNVLLATIVLTATTLPIAVLTWRMVERPAQRWAAGRAKPATRFAASPATAG